jgi:5,10-methylenetetrahydrofolate reductase
MTAQGCPKHMVFGPCGGVEADGTCELGDRRCTFLDLPAVGWRDDSAAPARPTTGAASMRALLGERPVVVADLSVRPMSATGTAEVAAVLRGAVDAVLVGDGPDDRVQFPPAHRAALLQAAGLAVVSGVNCRDRNRVALEGELAALADLGVAGVLAVTGDLPARGHRPDAQPVFDLDSTRLAALAAAAGHLVAVAEAPAAPPVERRPDRLVQKLAAGAEVCFVDHCGGLQPVLRFIEAVRESGADPRFVACVPVVASIDSAAMLAAFPALVLPDGYLEGILAAPDARRAGEDAAVRLAEQLLEAGVGVDLSGGAGREGHVAYAETVVRIAARLGVR